MCVNLSARQFAQPDIVEQVAEAIDAHAIDPSALCLEITESVVMEQTPATMATLDELKKLGVRLAIDDFGTGYSSLGYLQRFRLDFLKIDRSFVDGLGRDPGQTAIVDAVVRLAQALGLGVIAEGVETPEQLEALRDAGLRPGAGLSVRGSGAARSGRARCWTARAGLWLALIDRPVNN